MGKTVEQIYQKKSQHEHILARPDMYIGTIEPVTDDIWLYDEADTVMKQRKCTWIPGLYKIFDEILVNAADNKVRDFASQTTIKVWIDEHRVRVYNNGEGIPIQKHREHDLWIPEMIFGHLLTSSNYDDNEAKVTGGRNGYGAKLTNVFSSRFEVETVHSRSRKKFYMKWTDNMLQHEEPVIVSSDATDYTMVTFYPDFAKFHVDKFSEDMILMMKRRVYDVAGCTDKSMKCYLNDERLGLTTFPEYVDLYPTMGEERHKHSYSRVNDRWEVCVRVSNIGFQQVSFVNSIATIRGGTHVKYIIDQIVAKVTEAAKKKSKTDVKPHMIRPHIFLFVNCLIENPGFDSQTKETLNTVRTKFGSTCEIPNSMIDYILKSGIVERSVEMANSKLTKEMASKMKTSDRKQILGIPKLDDANEAGGKQSHRCTLILTEGDSAKTLCTAGLAVRGKDYFGVFPLRGKPLNVREASLKKVMQNEEIQNVMKIMGLDLRQKYTSTDGLRYGHLMIMSDQDHDGSHIKGLLINLIHYYWPDLLRVPGFLQQFITPIVKARKKGRSTAGGSDTGEVISFFSMPDYLEWKQSMGDRIKSYDLRYYKGLGTSGANEGREYFENIERHRLDFTERDPGEEDRIVMAFAKDRVEDRKEWITRYSTNQNPNELMDYTVKKVPYGDFIDKELILFSVADCERSIPSAIDGMKPGQRKILFSCFKRNLVRAIKVVQLAGYVSEHSAYHHGDQSLVQTIVGMAQDFVGSNNVPLLRQDGQFGTRLQGGKDSAAGRYIFTRLMQITRLIYHAADDFIVSYRDDDGKSVEPFFYVPIIPMVLVNSTSGIGTGFSTNIPGYNPIAIIDNLKKCMNGEPMTPMQPWYFGFTGTIEEREKGKFVSHGVYQVRPDGVVAVSELPIGTWTQNYKVFLEDLREKEMIVQYREHNTDVTVDFEIFVHPQVMQLWVSQDCVEEKLQLQAFVHATNIIAFNPEGKLTKYGDAESLTADFYTVRLDYYERRKTYLLGELRHMTNKYENMARFVREVVEGTLIVTKRKKKDLLDELRTRRYTPYPPQQKKNLSATAIDNEEEEEEDRRREQTDEEAAMLAVMGDDAGETPEVKRATRDYDYLLGMKLWTLTAEMIARLEALLQRAKKDLELLERKTPKEMWLEDLDVLRGKLISYFEERQKDIDALRRKKLEKKRPFDVRQLRVPLLSEKVKSALEKEQDKRGGGRRGEAASVEGSTAPAGEGVKPARKPAARKKRRKKDSDDDESLDESWLYGSDGDDDSEDAGIVGMGDDDSNPPTATTTTAAAKKKKPPAKRAPRKTTASTKRTKTEAPSTAFDAADDLFDLGDFGLDAIGGATPSSAATKPAVKYEKPFPSPPATKKSAATASSSSNAKPAKNEENDDDDELFELLALDSAGKKKSPARKTTPKKPTPKKTSSAGKATTATAGKKRKRGSDSDGDDDDSSSSSDSESSSGGSSASSSSDSDSSSESFDFSD